jgi:hypothetical protein
MHGVYYAGNMFAATRVLENKCLCVGYRARHLQIIALGRALSILMKFDNGTSKNS